MKYLLVGNEKVSPHKLINCYRLNPKDCILVHTEKDILGRYLHNYIVLTVREEGDYLEFLNEWVNSV
jgi:hypothetical protein